MPDYLEIPRFLHFVWVGGAIPRVHLENIAKWKAMNRNYQVWLWYDSANFLANTLRKKVSKLKLNSEREGPRFDLAQTAPATFGTDSGRRNDLRMLAGMRNHPEKDDDYYRERANDSCRAHPREREADEAEYGRLDWDHAGRHDDTERWHARCLRPCSGGRAGFLRIAKMGRPAHCPRHRGAIASSYWAMRAAVRVRAFLPRGEHLREPVATTPRAAGFLIIEGASTRPWRATAILAALW